ncbi:MAG: hypothetical protein WAT36_03625 [Chromatiaceae bacterium]
MKLQILAISLLLTGCAAPELLISDPNNIVVNADTKRPEEAQAIADKECAKVQQKAAKLNWQRKTNNLWSDYSFICIAPPTSR